MPLRSSQLLRHQMYVDSLAKTLKFVEENPQLKGPAQVALEALREETLPATLEANKTRMYLLDLAALEEKRLVLNLASSSDGPILLPPHAAKPGTAVLKDGIDIRSQDLSGARLLQDEYLAAGLAKDEMSAYQLKQNFVQEIAGALRSKAKA